MRFIQDDDHGPCVLVPMDVAERLGEMLDLVQQLYENRRTPGQLKAKFKAMREDDRLQTFRLRVREGGAA